MSLRVCPNCHTNLGNYDHYFCSVCQTVLPKEFVNTNVDIKVKLFDTSSATKAGILSKINLSVFTGLFHKQAFLGIVFILVITPVVLYLAQFIPAIGLGAKKPIVSQGSAVTPVPLHMLDLPLVGQSKTFDSEALNKYVPQTADLYIFGNNLGLFLSNVFSIKLYDALFSAYPQALDKPFVLFSLTTGEKSEWGIVVPQSESKVVSQILDKSLKDFGVYAFDGNYLIVASSKDVLALARDAGNKTAANISLNPAYVQAQTKLPKEGLGSLIFFSQSAKQTFESAKSYDIGSTLKNTIDAVLKTGYNEVVIF